VLDNNISYALAIMLMAKQNNRTVEWVNSFCFEVIGADEETFHLQLPAQITNLDCSNGIH
jgi:hypothetical protein